ncbi:hypothetical protein BLS_006984 [Venturia inaequalis]|uniref:Cytochrome c oxidase assembly factor 3 n=1 Tax=Venturia inaequalis TaxID=5025 RepID=A0A8H3V5G3_VENIN|nr:hypothetical protein BLS_006984 [Venturia inaequalis]
MPLIPRSSYYDQHFRQSAALIRARRPFLFRNLATGAALVTFTTGVYAYTILAVAQDNFDDVVPGAPRIDAARIGDAIPEIVEAYFKEPESILQRLKVKEDNIYNLEETDTAGASKVTRVVSSS